ncbi:uncharacterized protein LOC144372377 isoform X2 [Ictidomys tridecemlineatus]
MWALRCLDADPCPASPSCGILLLGLLLLEPTSTPGDSEPQKALLSEAQKSGVQVCRASSRCRHWRVLLPCPASVASPCCSWAPSAGVQSGPATKCSLGHVDQLPPVSGEFKHLGSEVPPEGSGLQQHHTGDQAVPDQTLRDSVPRGFRIWKSL